nr:MAG TPA: hypothetical protein [Caudoviricetes sp.]
MYPFIRYSKGRAPVLFSAGALSYPKYSVAEVTQVSLVPYTDMY